MELKLSIIVPIYNVEKYLRKCLDSLLQQNLSPEEYEIILVDDGSPDGCGAICDDYASQNGNIKVIHRTNGGLSAARNSGIEVAMGKYVQFVDSDDYLEPNVLGQLIQKMEMDDLDVLRFDYQNVNEDYEIIHPYKAPKQYVDLKDVVCEGPAFLNERLGPACYVWQFIFNRSLLINGDARFKEGIYFEDAEWTPRILNKAKRITSIDATVYYYLIRKGSITQAVDEIKKRKVLEDKILLIHSLQQQMKEVKDTRWYEGEISLTALSLYGLIYDCNREDRNKVLQALKRAKVYPLSTFNMNKAGISKIKMANFSPRLLCCLLRLKN